MRIRITNWITVTLSGLMILVFFLVIGCSAQSSLTASSSPTNSLPETGKALTPKPTKEDSPVIVSSNQVTIVVAGYINHGPLQPTVRAIKEVISKYGDKVAVTWIDMATPQGESYFKEHGLTAHMNVIINGTSSYQVNGKNVDFQWFEGQQWNKKDLDTVLSNLVNK